jgi:hypothetical protein
MTLAVIKLNSNKSVPPDMEIPARIQRADNYMYAEGPRADHPRCFSARGSSAVFSESGPLSALDQCELHVSL